MERACPGANPGVSEDTALAALIWCPFPDEPAARAAAGALLDERLIACVNLVPGLEALFAWSGERGEGRETGALFKTTAARLGAAMDRLRALHPYDTPAITGWTVRAEAGTLAWLQGETDSA